MNGGERKVRGGREGGREEGEVEGKGTERRESFLFIKQTNIISCTNMLNELWKYIYWYLVDS